MARERLSRNAPCPCDSGRKYKHCCYHKGFEWQEDEEGGVFRAGPITPEMKDNLQDQRQRFVEKYGREPGPGDPVFFDLPHPEHLEAMMAEDMRAAGLDPAFVYAFEKTGLIVSEQNQHLIPEKDLDEWDAAVREYEEKHRGREGPGGQERP